MCVEQAAGKVRHLLNRRANPADIVRMLRIKSALSFTVPFSQHEVYIRWRSAHRFTFRIAGIDDGWDVRAGRWLMTISRPCTA